MKLHPCFWQYVLPQHLLSRTFGKLAFCTWPWLKNKAIKDFIIRYGVDLSEAAIEDPTEFEHFNAFFTRALKPDARSIDATPNGFISPVDGAFSALGRVEHGQIFQAKNHNYSLEALLGANDSWVRTFQDALFATMYLAPKDYHRIHMPLTGTLKAMRYVPGKLFSVNTKTTEAVPGLFAKNERVILFFDTEFGPLAVILVGAMIVASVSTVFAGVVAPNGSKVIHRDYTSTPEHHILLKKGEEVGRFLLGSTVITLIGNSGCWQPDLSSGQTLRMGQLLSLLDS